MIDAPTTVASASTEPTDRSMPPMRMTKVMPTARIVLMEIWPRMRRKLSAVAKYGATTANTSVMRMSATPTPASRSEMRMTRFASGIAGAGGAASAWVSRRRSCASPVVLGATTTGAQDRGRIDVVPVRQLQDRSLAELARRSSSPTMAPREKTTMRWQMPSSSGRSDETTMMPLPSAARSQMRL